MAKTYSADIGAKTDKAKDSKDTKDKSKDKDKDKPHDGGWRETIESLLMAVILALLFKGYVAEAFVIPTGSMAPTLMGRHRDICCPQCNYRYQASASAEVDNETGVLKDNVYVISATCPVCRFTHAINPLKDANEASFSGDRIIVSKFAYEVSEPKRWDVIVFKYPGGATQNYIKRLIGLPGETLQIAGGNVYTRRDGESEFRIARKPPHKLTAMLQIVDDSDYIPEVLTKFGWPLRWRETVAAENAPKAWKTEDNGKSFVCTEVPAGMAWLRYRNFVPNYDDWEQMVVDRRLPADAHKWDGQLITDFYAYNTDISDRSPLPESARDPGVPPELGSLGEHWVDDIAVECLADLQDAKGTIAIDLVRAGVHYRCMIDVTDGKATLTRTSHTGTALPFADDAGKESTTNPTATTVVKGAGLYRLRMTNCDHEVMLFVNGKVVTFDQPTTYSSDRIVAPRWNQQDGLDLEPAGIGVNGMRAKVSQLKILRDKYYIAVKPGSGFHTEYKGGYSKPLDELFAVPADWESSGLFKAENRAEVEFVLGPDEFFPMGDNSPQSSDGRYWPKSDYLHRDLLIGKALFIYWPHSWNRPIPFQPNLQRMRPIH